MTKKNGLFVKINYGNTQRKITNGKKQLEIQNESSYRKFLFCAGIKNKQGGTMIFRAKDLEEAELIANNNPFVHNEMYTYEILKGDKVKLLY